MTILVLGDQLARGVGPLAERPDERVLMIEAHGFARRLPYHPHKLTLVFSAMRHFREDLRRVGRPLDYREVESFGDGFDAHFEDHPGDRIVTVQPTAHGAEGRLREMIEGRGGTLETTENPFFLCPESAFDDWAAGRKLPYRHEHFYRFMRRETGYLMEGDEPRGGRWNYDEENREPPEDGRFPEPPGFPPDGFTAEVAAWVGDEFDGGYGSRPYGGSWAEPEGFTWPVTRAQALEALGAFVEDRLAGFGPRQDAMLEAEWSMNHAVISPLMNVGLLRPAEVVEAAIAAAERDASIGLASLEGFVRQVIGWREFVRHAYRDTMPRLDGANRLDAGEDLPEFYWTGETDMACLSSVIDGVRRRG
ncbi:MAG: cryptochrome/photolyase family protein, partial [Halobacteriales archaeon]|nr:cryptochrome/photolyase family protein [Halobacteriales archaeon]